MHDGHIGPRVRPYDVEHLMLGDEDVRVPERLDGAQRK